MADPVTNAAAAPLRIAHLNSMLTGGGTDDQCVKLAAGLRRLGQAVWVCGPDGREFSKVARELGVPFHVTPPEGTLKLRFILSAARFIRRNRVQIVHGHHGRDLWPTILAARFSGVKPKIILTRHLAKSPASWPSRQFLLGQCDAMIAVSEFVAKVLREGDADPESGHPERHWRPPMRGDHSKMHVIHCGVDTDRFHPCDASMQRRDWGLAAEHFAFAVVGGYQLPRGKGQREFLQAAARIHQRVPQARFLIVGRGNMEEILKSDIERLGLRGKAWLTPYCADMPAAMNALDCLVHPQIGTEAFGLVVCEAFACGKPVIASNLDGVPEAFAAGGAGGLVQPDSIEELAAAMSCWAVRPPLSSPEREALRQRVVERFSVRVFAGRTLELYARLIRAPEFSCKCK